MISSTAREADHGRPTSVSGRISTLVLTLLIALALRAAPACADALAADAAGPASAPAGAKSEPSELQEILVTAEKREETIQATPIAGVPS